MYKNSEILAAVINKFAEPIITQFAGSKMSSMAWYQVTENFVKKWLPVSSNYQLYQDLSVFINGGTAKLLQPVLEQYLSKIPDDMIPVMAHSIVDSALANGEINFAEGRLQFEKEDLLELKKLLNYNLPLPKKDEYQVIMSMPEKEVTNGTETSTDKQQIK